MSGEADGVNRRLALLIAASRYDELAFAQLRSPGSDADGLAGVLGDPDIGGFDVVRKRVNVAHDELLQSIEDFCLDARADDLVLVYLSCHGLLDERGRLRYVATDTRRHRLASTAVAAVWLNELLDDCRARTQILILDCCHSGAFADGRKGLLELGLEKRFMPHQSRGRVVLTASRKTEYSFENDNPSGDGVQSVFTRILIEGLRTGDADLDGDGKITIIDLYRYLYYKVRATEPRQTPQLWSYGVEGDVLLASSVRGVVREPVPGADDPAVQAESSLRPQPGGDTASKPAPQPRRVGRVLTRWIAITMIGAILAVGLTIAVIGFDSSGLSAAIRWTYRTSGPVDSSPAVADGTIYVGSDGGYVYALDAGTGRLLWRQHTDGPVGSRPAVANGTVYVGSGGGYVYALDADTGSVRWSKAPGGPIDSPAVVADGTVYVGSNDGYVYALAAGSGSLRWSHKIGRVNVTASLAVAGGNVYVGCTSGSVLALAAGTGSLRWTYLTGGPVNSSPAVVGGTVYVGSDDGKVYALSAANGHSDWWYLTGTNDDVYPSPAVVGGTVYIGSGDGDMYALNARDGRLRWAHSTRGPVDSSPAVVGGTVYVASNDGYVYALDAGNGRLRWAYLTAGIRFSSPAVVGGTAPVGGTVYIGSNEGDELYALNSGS